MAGSPRTLKWVTPSLVPAYELRSDAFDWKTFVSRWSRTCSFNGPLWRARTLTYNQCRCVSCMKVSALSPQVQSRRVESRGSGVRMWLRYDCAAVCVRVCVLHARACGASMMAQYSKQPALTTRLRR